MDQRYNKQRIIYFRRDTTYLVLMGLLTINICIFIYSGIAHDILVPFGEKYPSVLSRPGGKPLDLLKTLTVFAVFVPIMAWLVYRLYSSFQIYEPEWKTKGVLTRTIPKLNMFASVVLLCVVIVWLISALLTGAQRVNGFPVVQLVCILVYLALSAICRAAENTVISRDE